MCVGGGKGVKQTDRQTDKRRRELARRVLGKSETQCQGREEYQKRETEQEERDRVSGKSGVGVPGEER